MGTTLAVRAFAVLMLAATAPALADTDCATAEAAAKVARNTADLPASVAAFKSAHACDGPTRERLGRMTAQTCALSLQASGAAVEQVEAQLRNCLKYGRDWGVLSDLADLDFASGRFAEAASRYDEALTIIGDEAKVPTRPPESVLSHLYERGDESRRLAIRLPRSTRSADGRPIGLASLGMRGFIPKRRQLSIRFEFDSTAFTAEGRGAAEELRDALAAECHSRIELVGHTDDLGDEAYNLRLSQERATALLKFVRGKPLPADCRLEASGRGELEPPRLSSGQEYDLDQKRMLARRVEVRRD